MAFALGELHWVLRTTWSWPLFMWGVLIGLAGFGIAQVQWLLLSRRFEANEAARQQMTARRPIYFLFAVGGGATIGGLSAATDMGWIDVVGAAYFALVTVAGTIWGAVVIRRMQVKRAAESS
jgi:hypothetical protein